MKFKPLSPPFYLHVILILNFFLIKTVEIIHKSNIKLCGISDSLEEIAAFFSSLKIFFTTLQGFFSVLGASTLLLFIAVIILSAGLSTLGIPRGKISFLSSLIIADIIWVLWEKSYNADFSSYAATIIKSNALLCLPLFIIAAIKKIKAVIKKFILNKKFGDNASYGNDTIRQIEDACYLFHHSFMKDLLSETKPIYLSEETKNAGKKLIETLKKIT